MQVSDVVRLLVNAKRPLLHVGQGVRIAKAIPEFFAFIEKAGIPVLTARNGNDLIASDHPLYIGRPGTFAQRGANFAVQSCDFYLAVGTRLGLAQTGYNAKDYARNAVKVMVDINEAELNKGTIHLDLKVLADAKLFLGELGEYGGWPDWSAWLAHCKILQAKYPPINEEQKQNGEYVNSYALINRLCDLCNENDIIVTDVGFSYQNVSQAWRVKQGQRLITNGGTAAMGWGLPAAIGAAIGTGRRVILIVGDGGLMFNVQELATLLHHKLNVKIFLLNNKGYLTMRQSQMNAFGAFMGSDEKDLSFPRFRDLARAFGLWGVSRKIEDAFDLAGPRLCEIDMDPEQEQIPKSINRRNADGSIQQTTLEDSYPFLDPAEVAENLRAA